MAPGRNGETWWARRLKNKTVIVVKQNAHGQETWRYPGRLLDQRVDRVVLEAYFDREDMSVHGLPLGKGDRFVETYYFDRWYNIFEIYRRADGALSGWYCNVSRPARLHGDRLAYDDLALDLIVFPDGRQLVLDEDEFETLPLASTDRGAARAALTELQTLFRNGQGPGQGSEVK